MRELAKRIPGAKLFYRSFIRTPGGWIFSRGNTRWLSEPEPAKDLPLLFRLFGQACRFAPEFRGVVFGAELVHAIVSGITHLLGLREDARVETPAGTVFVLLTDPRSLVVPGEVAGGGEVALLRELLEPGDTFVDIGANHGSFSIVAASVVGDAGLVVAVEPQPKLAALVEKSLHANHASRFEVHNLALADEPGSAEFFVPRATSGSAGLYRGFSAISAAHRYTVRLERFDDLLAWREFPGRCTVKIDVEGAEVKVLRGAREAILHHRPMLMAEVNPHSLDAAGVSIEEFAGTLKELGYRQYKEIGGSTPEPLESLDRRQRNILVLP